MGFLRSCCSLLGGSDVNKRKNSPWKVFDREPAGKVTNVVFVKEMVEKAKAALREERQYVSKSTVRISSDLRLTARELSSNMDTERDVEILPALNATIKEEGGRVTPFGLSMLPRLPS